MIEENNKSFYEKNKFSYATIQHVKDNIVNSKDPIYNPIALVGLDKGLRYRMLMSKFDMEFNKEYKGIYTYCSCDNLDLNTVKDKRLIIIENIELLDGNKELQNKLKELLMICFDKKIQLILCLDVDIKELDINEILKSKMLTGLNSYLVR